MIAAALKILSLIQMLWEIVKSILAAIEARRIRRAEEKRAAREKAAEDLANAKTEEEFNRAQDELTRNKP